MELNYWRGFDWKKMILQKKNPLRYPVNEKGLNRYVWTIVALWPVLYFSLKLWKPNVYIGVLFPFFFLFTLKRNVDLNGISFTRCIPTTSKYRKSFSYCTVFSAINVNGQAAPDKSESPWIDLIKVGFLFNPIQIHLCSQSNLIKYKMK